MFKRSNSVTPSPPRKPKIAKIPLPDMDQQDARSPISRPSLSPRRPMPPTTMMTPAALPATGRTPKPRGVRVLDDVPPTSGYFSEPGSGPSRPIPRKNVQSSLGPMKQGDGPSRSKGSADDLDGLERPTCRRVGSSGRNPNPVATFMAPSLNETPRCRLRTAETNPLVAKPQVLPSAMKRKPSEGPSVGPAVNATPSVKKEVPSPIPIRSRTFSYASAAPELRTTKTVNFVHSPTEETIPNIHWQLLPYQPLRSKHCLHFDVSLPPENISACGRVVKPEQFEKLAASCPLTEMIIQGDLRWKIVVKKRKGITCEDVFQAIYDTYDKPLTDVDRANSDPKQLKKCEGAFKRRCDAVPRLSERERRIGMKRVDLLNGKTFFHGLTKPDVDSHWKLELKTQPPCGRVFP